MQDIALILGVSMFAAAVIVAIYDRIRRGNE